MTLFGSAVTTDNTKLSFRSHSAIKQEQCRPRCQFFHLPPRNTCKARKIGFVLKARPSCLFACLFGRRGWGLFYDICSSRSAKYPTNKKRNRGIDSRLAETTHTSDGAIGNVCLFVCLLSTRNFCRKESPPSLILLKARFNILFSCIFISNEAPCVL